MKATKLLAVSLMGVSTAAIAQTKPNIVLIIGDDCRYQDLACYGSKDAITPNIDKLADEGLKFNRFFQATAMSSPTRHCLLTGIYPVRSGAYPNHTFIKDDITTLPKYLKDAGYRVALQGKRHIAPEKAFPFEYLSGGGANVDIDRIEPFIADAVAAKEPFFLFVASHDPHSPWTRGDRSLFDADKITLPPYLVDTEKTRENYVNYLAEINQLDTDVGKVDALIKKYGLDKNTIFIFTSEQGHSFPFAKWTCYDAGLHTGFIVRWDGVTQPGTTTDALCEYVDVTPTLLDIAGAKIPKNLDGKSFLKVIQGKTDKFKEYVYSLHTTRGIINGSEYYGIRSVRNGTFRYILNLTPEAEFRNAATANKDAVWQSWLQKAKTDAFAQQQVNNYQHRPAEELYNTATDPFEMNNLINDPRYAKEVKMLRKKLSAWMKQQGDEGQATEMKALERQPKNVTNDD
ncbi:MAG: sulfatase [Tannerella sp.]|jgi:uncharacterized sulfatase|nr:sulfatase [Tannerella sp.]